MAKRQSAPRSGSLSGDLIDALSLSELCRSCGVRADWVIELVEEGILDPAGHDPTAWRFSATSIRRTRTAWRLQRDLGVNRAGIAVVLNLMDERDELHIRLRRREFQGVWPGKNLRANCPVRPLSEGRRGRPARTC